jgi:hypothetical protein
MLLIALVAASGMSNPPSEQHLHLSLLVKPKPLRGYLSNISLLREHGVVKET